MPQIDADLLRTFAAQLLEAGGATPHDAEIVSESLVQANLRGHDSHGVMRIPSYLENVKNGRIKPGKSLEVITEAPGTIVGDGGWGFGQVISHELMDRLIEKAATQGVASGTLRRTAHIGRLGEYAELAASNNMASMVIANTHGAAHRVAPVGAKAPRLGTNPICMGMPGGEHGPFVLDFGTSATAEGKVRVKRIAGEQVPPGLILDAEGNPSTDPHVIYGDPPGTILPMGGNQAYKGFGLAYMIEMFSGGLSAGQCSFPDPPPPLGNCALFVLFNPELFGGFDHMSQEVSQLERYVRSSPAIDPEKPVTLPGDPELRTLATRSESGIPLDDGNWKALTDLATELGVESP
ncbi:MAG: Ldh family oxidoreductase [Planctomycetaceae bacterium]|nr:Ldh family oxidoreductase [Planctomycetaceae bacterium]